MSDVAAQAWPVPRVGSGSAAAALVCALGAVCAFAVAVLAGSRSVPEVAPTPVIVAPIPAAPRWLEVVKPVQIFSLEAPQFRRESLAYAARRLVSGLTREDTLAYGTPSGEAPMLRLALVRGSSPDTGSALGGGMARIAERQGLDPTIGTKRGALTTRFGRFDTATLRISGRAGACDGFHLALAAPALSVDGIACGTARGDLACLIDRLDLVSAGDDRPLADLFAATELHRNPACAGMRLGPDVVHAAWLDDKRATPLKKMRR